MTISEYLKRSRKDKNKQTNISDKQKRTKRNKFKTRVGLKATDQKIFKHKNMAGPSFQDNQRIFNVHDLQMTPSF